MSIEILTQKVNGVFTPYSVNDVEEAEEYKDNQIVKIKITGCRKQRSASQLGLLHACIKLVSDNSEDENWNTPGRAKLSLKALLNYVDESACVVVNKKVVIQYRSFSYADLKHMEACNLFDRAFPLLADIIGLTGDQLIAEAQKLMNGRLIR